MDRTCSRPGYPAFPADSGLPVVDGLLGPGPGPNLLAKETQLHLSSHLSELLIVAWLPGFLIPGCCLPGYLPGTIYGQAQMRLLKPSARLLQLRTSLSLSSCLAQRVLLSSCDASKATVFQVMKRCSGCSFSLGRNCKRQSCCSDCVLPWHVCLPMQFLNSLKTDRVF